METETLFFQEKDILQLEARQRTNLINSLSGFKSANLIGTRNSDNQYNLAIFSSVVHIGANPPLMGFIQRPDSVERHTYENILETKEYTINSISTNLIEKAHQTAARYSRSESEFEMVGLTPLLADNFFAPFVKEAQLQIGLQLAEIVPIKSNDTILVVGKVVSITFPKQALNSDGSISHTFMNSACITGLDTYHQAEKIAQFSYAKPHQKLSKL